MRVSFKLGEPLWRAVGSRETTVEFGAPGVAAATVGQALDALAAAHPEAGREMRLGSQESDFYYSLFVNDRLVLFSKRDTAMLRDGDEVSILLPLAGGGTGIP